MASEIIPYSNWVESNPLYKTTQQAKLITAQLGEFTWISLLDAWKKNKYYTTEN